MEGGRWRMRDKVWESDRRARGGGRQGWWEEGGLSNQRHRPPSTPTYAPHTH